MKRSRGALKNFSCFEGCCSGGSFKCLIWYEAVIPHPGCGMSCFWRMSGSGRIQPA